MRGAKCVQKKPHDVGRKHQKNFRDQGRNPSGTSWTKKNTIMAPNRGNFNVYKWGGGLQQILSFFSSDPPDPHTGWSHGGKVDADNGAGRANEGPVR